MDQFVCGAERGRRIDAVIFDLDGVVRHWDPAIISGAEAQAGLPTGVLADAVLRDPALLREVTTGRITDTEWRATIGVRLHTRYGPGGPIAVREWSSTAGEVVPEILDLVRSTREHTTVALLTNATSRLQADLAQLDLLAEFDAIFNSADLGVAKPDPAAVLTACAALGVDPHHCAFVDDSPGNVETARGAGLLTHLYRSGPALAAFLAKLRAWSDGDPTPDP